jgi:hypothetical protein
LVGAAPSHRVYTAESEQQARKPFQSSCQQSLRSILVAPVVKAKCSSSNRLQYLHGAWSMEDGVLGTIGKHGSSGIGCGRMTTVHACLCSAHLPALDDRSSSPCSEVEPYSKQFANESAGQILQWNSASILRIGEIDR